MLEKTTQTIVELLKLSKEERKIFATEISGLIGEIFEVKDNDRLINNFVNPTSDVIKIRVFHNTENKMVGFIKYTIDFGIYKGRKYAGFNSHAGFLRAYRGNSTTVIDGMKAMLKFKLRHPTWEVYYFGILIHPSSYSLFAKYAVDYWPRYDKTTPPEQEKRMIELTRPYAGDESVYNKDYPFSRMYYLGTHTIPQEEEYWKNSEKETVKYFLKTNPRYTEGAGIFTWITMDFKFIRSSTIRFAKETLQKKWKNLKAIAYTSPLGKKILPQPDIVAIMRKIPTFEKIADEDLQRVSKSATVASFPPGKYIMRAGDNGDSMYIIIQGSTYVVLDFEEEEVIVDQLSSGDFFGEMALMSGEPRTASVRTVTSTVLVRIDRRSFIDFLDSNAEIKNVAWQIFGKRRFDKYLIDHERFENLDHITRNKWYESASHKVLNKGTDQKIPASNYLFIIAGSVEIKQNDNWLSMKAPALLKFSMDWVARASTDSRICLLNENVVKNSI